MSRNMNISFNRLRAWR